MGIFRFDRSGQIVAFEEKPKPDRLEEIGRSIPAGGVFAGHTERQAVHRVDGRLRLLARRPARNPERRAGDKDFGREVIPAALGRYHVNPYLFRGYWADVGTVASFYEANIMLTRPGAPFNFYDPDRPIYTHPRFLPGSRLSDCTIRHSIVAEGCYLDRCTIEDSIIGIRTSVQQRRRRSAGRCCSARTSTRPIRRRRRAATRRGSASGRTWCSIG